MQKRSANNPLFIQILLFSGMLVSISFFCRDVVAEVSASSGSNAIETIINSLIDPFNIPKGLQKAQDEKKAAALAVEQAAAVAAVAEEQKRLAAEQPQQDPLVALPVVTPTMTISLPQLTLSGVIYDTPKPQAIIDGEVYNLGDEVNFGQGAGVAKIMLIEKGQVTISYMGSPFILTTDSNASSTGMAQSGISQSGMSQSGMSESGMSQLGLGMPQSGTIQSSMSQSGVTQ